MENTAFSLWLQALEAKFMVYALSWLNNIGVAACSLIHDRSLIKSSDQPRVDVAALGEFVRAGADLRCSFQIKSLNLEDHDPT
jgi:hypothetical protein